MILFVLDISSRDVNSLSNIICTVSKMQYIYSAPVSFVKDICY